MSIHTKTLGTLTSRGEFENSEMYPYPGNHPYRSRQHLIRNSEKMRLEKWRHRPPYRQNPLGPLAATLLFTLLLALLIWGDKF